MSEVEKLLKETNLPELLDRAQMKKLLLDNEYGYVPDIPFQMSVSEPKMLESRFCCGKAQLSQVDMTITTALGSHTFPVKRLLHTDGEDHPFFVFICFKSMEQ